MDKTSFTTPVPSVANMLSRDGNVAANQFIISEPRRVIFQSYDSIIVVVEKNKEGNGDNVFIDKNKWDWSRTTSKYRSLFFGESTAETQRKIDTGAYIITDLNIKGGE